MEAEYEMQYHEVAETHCWCVARRNIILSIICNLKIMPHQHILEVGCGGGALLHELKQNNFSNVTGIDLSNIALSFCKTRERNNVHLMDATQLDFPTGSLDLVIASDLLEHIQHEDTALSEWNRVLKKDGFLIIFVPAFQFLWSDYDEINEHHRRYSKQKLINVLIKNNFVIEKISFWNFSFFIPAAIERIILKYYNPGKKKGPVFALPGFLNRLLLGVLNMENCMVRLVGAPIGVSLFAIVRKRQL